jgi:hypothetical protein
VSASEDRSEIDVRSIPDDLLIGGFHVHRNAAYYKGHDEEDQGITWKLSPAVTEAHDFVILGDLTICGAHMFGGVQITCFVSLPWRQGKPITDDEWPLADALVQRHADSVTHAMYDFAAQAMRSQFAGYSYPPTVPLTTPKFTLQLASSSESPASVDDDGGDND